MGNGRTWRSASQRARKRISQGSCVPDPKRGRRDGVRPFRIRTETRLHAVIPAVLAAALFFLHGLPRPASAQIVALPRADSSAGDFFGASVDIYGDRVLVGATGIDVCGANSGAVYVYRRTLDAEHWEQEAVLQPSDCEAGAFFGRSVSLGDRFAVVAASREFFSRETPNAVYVFERDAEDAAWRQVAKLTGGLASDEGSFATSVAIDGTRLLVTTSGDPSGERADGAAYIFELDQATNQWVRAHRIDAGSSSSPGVFGTSGALHGDVAAVTASTYFNNRPGSIFIFKSDAEGSWNEVGRFGDIEDFFISVDVDGARVAVGESKARSNESGAVTLFEAQADGKWQVADVLRPSQPYDAGAFGSSVAVDGDYLLAVGFDEQLGLDINIDRVVFVFKRDPTSGTWRQYHVIDVGEVAFGADVALHGGYAVIGSSSEEEPGAAYVVRMPE